MATIQTNTSVPPVAVGNTNLNEIKFTPIDFARNATIMQKNIETTALIAAALDSGKIVLWKNGEQAGQPVDYKKCWDNYIGTCRKHVVIGNHRLEHGLLEPKSLDDAWKHLGDTFDATSEKVSNVAVAKGIQPKPQAEEAPVVAAQTAPQSKSTLKTAAKATVVTAAIAGLTYGGFQYSDYLGDATTSTITSIYDKIAGLFYTDPSYYAYEAASTGLGSASYVGSLIDGFNDLSGVSQAGVATAAVVGVGLAAVGTYKYGKRVLNAAATPFVALKNYFRPQQTAVQTT